jgi:hypothetical protein
VTRESPYLRAMLAEAVERRRRLDECPRHHFPHQAGGYVLGAKVRCDRCGGDLRLSDIGLYLRGYVAAGGNPDDVMPDWRERHGG